MSEWIDSLTDPQVRALAHQSGVSGSMTFPAEKLRGKLRDSVVVAAIYEEQYGQEADI